VPAAEIEEEAEKNLHAAWNETRTNAVKAYEELSLNKALELINEFVKKMNAYLEQRAPWKLAKSTDALDAKRLKTSLALVAEGLRLAVSL
jgi:methionyl-tRNA synthetase